MNIYAFYHENPLHAEIPVGGYPLLNEIMTDLQWENINVLSKDDLS